MGTELDIVNHMLRTNGERQVPQLNGSPSVIQAQGVLKSENQDFQSKGWWFNKEFQFKLSQDENGEIRIPDECLAFEITFSTLQRMTAEQKARFVKRGGRLYDAVKHTYTIGTDVWADFTLDIPIEDLPATAFNYLKASCAKAICMNEDGDPQKMARLDEKLLIAHTLLNAEQMRVTGLNMMDSLAVQHMNYRIGQYGIGTNPAYPGGR